MTNTLNSCKKTQPLIITVKIKGFQGLLKNSRTFKALKMTPVRTLLHLRTTMGTVPCRSCIEHALPIGSTQVTWMSPIWSWPSHQFQLHKSVLSTKLEAEVENKWGSLKTSMAQGIYLLKKMVLLVVRKKKISIHSRCWKWQKWALTPATDSVSRPWINANDSNMPCHSEALPQLLWSHKVCFYSRSMCTDAAKLRYLQGRLFRVPNKEKLSSAWLEQFF